MHNIIRAFPLYNFLNYCNSNAHDKIVLDCGAGGSNPPLSLFYEFKYKTYGIELSDEQLKMANEFCEMHNMELNIVKGDMTQIPYSNNYFSFLYSYNTSVHMRKSDFSSAMEEFLRVLKPNGLCFVNFLSKECDTYGVGVEISEGEFRQREFDQEVLYTHYEEDELIHSFKGFEIIYSEKRLIRRIMKDEVCSSSYLDFILRKR